MSNQAKRFGDKMSKKNGSIGVLLVDDFVLSRSFFAEGLRRNKRLRLCEAASETEAMDILQSGETDVVLLNISMRHCSGMSLLQLIHNQFPALGLLVFSYLHHDHLYAERALCAGAAGYISIDEPAENLVKAIELVANDGVYLSSALRQKLCLDVGFQSTKRESPFERLSHREFEVFCLTGHGYVPKRIAERLKVSVKTVETYRERIREKLGLGDGGDLLYHASSFIREQSVS